MRNNKKVASPATSSVPVSVIILTYNEANNIGDCIASLKWAAEVIVVDSYSKDDTLDIATQTRSDVRVFQNSFEDFGQQRNWALKCTSPVHKWILFLDADERIDASCAKAIAETIAEPGNQVGFYLTCRNIFLGRWIKRSTLYPSWQLRLLLQGEVYYRKEGHGQREVTEGHLGYIDEPYDHYGFSNGIHHWIERHNHYSTHEIELIHRLQREPVMLNELLSSDPIVRRRCLKRIAARVGFRPLFRFLYLYVVRGGFLDGRPGFLFSLLRVAHEIHITVKLEEHRKKRFDFPVTHREQSTTP